MDLTAILPKARAEVFRLLFVEPGKEVHVRDLARLAGLTPAAMQKELGYLQEIGLVVGERDGNRLYYRAQTTHPLFPELRRLVLKTTGIVPELQKALAKVPGIELAFVFGSVAAGTAKPDSDVDVMLIGTTGLRKVTPVLRKASGHLAREINPHCLTAEEWRQKKSKKDVFVTRVLNEPKLWMKGGDDELGKLG
ncbi:MAG: nucleotidyltransferase domain-containing protein [Prosthecobacter sp.]